jgi:hypothetical protein
MVASVAGATAAPFTSTLSKTERVFAVNVHTMAPRPKAFMIPVNIGAQHAVLTRIASLAILHRLAHVVFPSCPGTVFTEGIPL